MRYLAEILARADIQQICSFLLYGAECAVDPRPGEERERSALQHITDRLQALLPEAVDEITSLVYEYGNAFQDVYMEIGLQAGIKMAAHACRKLESGSG